MNTHGLSDSKTVARSAVWNVAGYVVASAYVILVVPIVVGYVGIEQFGLWSLIVALTGYIGLTDLGVATSFVKFIAEYQSRGDRENVNSVVRHGILFYLAVSAIFLLAGALASPYIFPLIGIPASKQSLAWNLLLLYLIGFAINNLATVYTSVLAGLQRMDVLNGMQSLVLVIRFGAVVLALAMGAGLPGMAFAEIGVAVVSLIAGIMAARRCHPDLRLGPWEYDNRMMMRLVKFGSQLQVSRLSELVQAHFDKFLIGRWIGLSPVSIYDFGSRPIGRIRSLASVAANSLLPAISALDAEDNDDRIRAALVRSTRYLAMVFAPIFAFVALFADELMTVWLGGGYEVAAMTLRVFSVAAFVIVLVTPLGYIAQGRGEPQFQMWNTGVQAGANVLFSVILMQYFGYFGAVVGTSLAGVLGAVLFVLVYGKRLLDAPVRLYVHAAVKPLISLMPAAVSTRLLLDWVSMTAGEVSRWVLLLHLVLTGVLLCGVYCAFLLLLRAFSADDRGFLLSVLPGRLQKYVQKLNAD